MISKEDRCQYRLLFRLAFPDHVHSLERARFARREANRPGVNAAHARRHRQKYLSEHQAKDRARYSARLEAGYFRAAGKRYYSKNKGACLAYSTESYARKKGAVIGNRKALVRVYKRAEELRKWFNVAVDHIIPISKGGHHSADNLQIIYASENRKKWDRLDYTPSVIFR